MTKVELVIRDEDGNILSQLDPCLMDLGSQSLHDMEADLLDKAQSQFKQQAKKQWTHL